MTDKKNIINPDEDFELDGLSNFVEDLNKEGTSPSLSKDENDVNSILDSGDEFTSFLNDDNDDLNLDDLNLSAKDENDDFEFDTNLDDDFDITSSNSKDEHKNLLDDDFDIASLDTVESNKNLLDEDNISSEEFKNLVESSNNEEFSFENDSDTDLDLSGITEMELPDEKDVFGDSDNSWDKKDVESSIKDDDLDGLDKFEFEDSNNSFESHDSEKDDFSSSFDNFDEDLDDKKLDDLNFDSLPSDSFDTKNNSNSHVEDEDEFGHHESSDLEKEWTHNTNDDDEHSFDNSSLDELLTDEHEPTIIPVPVPVPVKEGFFSKIKNKLSKKKPNEEEDETDHSNLNASRDEDESSYINLDSNLDNDSNNSLLSDEDEANRIEAENKKKANKGNIIKLTVLAVVIAAIAGGYYYMKHSNTGLLGVDESDNSDLAVQKPVNTKGNVRNINGGSLSSNDSLGNPTIGSGLSSTQVTDLKREIMAQMTADKTAMEQRVTALEKENTMLKGVINQVQTSIDPDQINRFKIEFNDLNSKTKQLDVQFTDDQTANKVMATNFFAVVKKLNDELADVKQTTARQDSLDEQTKRIDNTFKQFVKMKDKAAEDNIPYRVDLIEKRMKFRNPNGDRTFEDKNNVRKVLSEGLFEGDTVKQEQAIPDVKYKYSFVGMIEGVIYLKNQSGDIKDFKVGDVLPGYGEVLKINENGSVETEKLGTVSFK